MGGNRPALRLELLGHFAIAHEGAAASSGESASPRYPPRLQSLVAYLLLHPETQDRQQLAFRFWPDSTEGQARANLRFFLHRLRRALPDADRFLRFDEGTVEWREDAPFTCDVAEFESALAEAEHADASEQPRLLERAATLYRGDLLPSCYDDWILPERERLRQRFVGALEQLVELLETRGDYRPAIAQAQRLLLYDPLHEEIYRRLMRLYASSGDRVGALRVYHTCVAVLERELGVEPSPATRAEYEGLLQAEPLGREIRPRPLPEHATLGIESGPPNNLPIALTSFIGRTREKAEIEELLTANPPATRLLTLTGAGGSGKTRLALEVAAGLLLSQQFPDGVWVVDLAPLNDRALVAPALATVLGVRESRATPLIKALVEFLRRRRALVLLDNCEHLIAECAGMAEGLLRGCPRLRLMTTSREPLNVAGETVSSVPPLSLPELEQSAPDLLSTVMQSEAVRLFNERATNALPTFQLTRSNASAVAEICRRLDGMPLAIELAAARVKMLKPDQIAARLDDRFHLLTGGSRTALVRHQSLRAVMDWSYELLNTQERLLFQRLGVFVGGFTLEAVEAVCADDEGKDQETSALNRDGSALSRVEVLDLLARLVDRSLVVAEEQPGEARYRLLETVRQYALAKWSEGDGEEGIRRRHEAYYFSLALAARTALRGAEQLLWLNRLEREHDNLRAGLQWTIDRGDSDTALRMCAALEVFWNTRGHQAEGRRWTEAALALSSNASTPAHAEALLRLGILMSNVGDYEVARRRLEESLDLARTIGYKTGTAQSLLELGVLDHYGGDDHLARQKIEEGLRLWREIGDPFGIAFALQRLALVGGAEGYSITAEARACYEESLKLFRQVGAIRETALVLNGLGEVERGEGEYVRAAAYYEESLIKLKQLGDKTLTAVLLNNLGYVALRLGDKARTAGSFLESMKLWRELGATRGFPESLAGLAGVAAAAGLLAPAVRVLGAAAALREARGDVWDIADQKEFEQIEAALRDRMDAEAFEEAWAEGHAMGVEQAVEYAQELAKTCCSGPPP